MSIPSSNVKYVAVNCLLEAIGTAKDRYVVSPVAGTVRQIFSVLDVTVDGDNALSFAIDGTAITGSGITHASSGSAAGEVKQSTPTGANTVKKGSAIKCTTDGGGSTGQARITILIEQE